MYFLWKWTKISSKNNKFNWFNYVYLFRNCIYQSNEINKKHNKKSLLSVHKTERFKMNVKDWSYEKMMGWWQQWCESDV